MLAEAKREAERVVKEAREQSERLISSEEVYRQAERAAEEIIEDARETERQIRLGAEDYADEILSTLEVNLEKFLSAVQRGRDRLAGRDDEPVEVGYFIVASSPSVRRVQARRRSCEELYRAGRIFPLLAVCNDISVSALRGGGRRRPLPRPSAERTQRELPTKDTVSAQLASSRSAVGCGTSASRRTSSSARPARSMRSTTSLRTVAFPRDSSRWFRTRAPSPRRWSATRSAPLTRTPLWSVRRRSPRSRDPATSLSVTRRPRARRDRWRSVVGSTPRTPNIPGPSWPMARRRDVLGIEHVRRRCPARLARLRTGKRGRQLPGLRDLLAHLHGNSLGRVDDSAPTPAATRVSSAPRGSGRTGGVIDDATYAWMVSSAPGGVGNYASAGTPGIAGGWHASVWSIVGATCCSRSPLCARARPPGISPPPTIDPGDPAPPEPPVGGEPDTVSNQFEIGRFFRDKDKGLGGDRPCRFLALAP